MSREYRACRRLLAICAAGSIVAIAAGAAPVAVVVALGCITLSA
jgi:hypothetical protein